MEHDVCEGQLAAEFVGHWDNAYIGDIGMAQKMALKFRRGNLEATDFNQLLQMTVVSIGGSSQRGAISP